jgi:hypothetical protein
MKLKVNRKNVVVFEGAEVRHAVLTYLALKGMDVRMADSLTVYDRWGHEIDLSAPASQHEVIKIKLPKPKTNENKNSVNAADDRRPDGFGTGSQGGPHSFD